MGNEFIVFLGDTFLGLQTQHARGLVKDDGYMLVSFHVPLNALYRLYEQFVRDNIPPIESLESTLKTKFWEIAKRYYTDEGLAVKASKAAYVLHLITSS